MNTLHYDPHRWVPSAVITAITAIASAICTPLLFQGLDLVPTYYIAAFCVSTTCIFSLMAWVASVEIVEHFDAKLYHERYAPDWWPKPKLFP